MTLLKTDCPLADIVTSKPRAILLAILSISCLFAFAGRAQAGATAAPGSSAPYLIIHLDAIPSKLFFEEYDAGRLPNIKAAFEDGKIVRHAVSPFFPGTEMLYPRLKNGLDVEAQMPITWEMYDRESGETTSHIQTILKLFSYLPRYSLTQIIHSVPGMDLLAGCALLNTPRMLDEYSIVEFFWFITDAYGHVFGEESQKESIAILDDFFGLLLRQLGSKPVNLVLYADHGMSMFERDYDAEAAMSEIAGDNVEFLYYPNLHLRDPSLAQNTAERLAARDELDFAFYRADESLIVGVHKNGRVMFRSEGGSISYSCNGPDPFGYFRLGYQGQPLSDQQWLDLTCKERFPAVPVQIVRYMDNPLSGDIVAVLNPPKALKTAVGIAGCHAGFADTDCVVGILMKGPDIDPSKIPDTFWLHRLHRDILEIDPGNPETARRERNSLMVSGGRIELQASPAHRWNGMLSAGSDGWTVTCERSLARSLITQIWTGLGITSGGEPAGSPTPVASSRLNFYLGPLVYEYKNLILLPSGKRISSSRLRVETKCGVIVEWSHPNRIGLGITW